MRQRKHDGLTAVGARKGDDEVVFLRRLIGKADSGKVSAAGNGEPILSCCPLSSLPLQDISIQIDEWQEIDELRVRPRTRLRRMGSRPSQRRRQYRNQDHTDTDANRKRPMGSSRRLPRNGRGVRGGVRRCDRFSRRRARGLARRGGRIARQFGQQRRYRAPRRSKYCSNGGVIASSQ